MGAPVKWADMPPVAFKKRDFDKLLLWAHDSGFSDVFFESDAPPAVRKDNEVFDVSEVPVSKDSFKRIVTDIYSATGYDRVVARQPIDFPYKALTVDSDDGEVVRFRVHGCGVMGDAGEMSHVELTIRPIASAPPTIEQLQVPEAIYRNLFPASGLVLVSGPTGSGKTTLISSCIGHFGQNNRKRVCTYESPIEFDFHTVPNLRARIRQTEVGPSGHVDTFADAVKTLMRRSSQYAYLGELRDADSINGALTASQAGQCVLSTTHANSVAEIIPRMADAYQNRLQIISTLIDQSRFFVHQRLVDAPGGGRTPIQEYVAFSESDRTRLLAKVAEDPEGVAEYIREHVKASGLPLLQDARNKYSRGLVTTNEFIRIAAERGQLSAERDLVLSQIDKNRAAGLISEEQAVAEIEAMTNE